jgi:hypothetical protein
MTVAEIMEQAKTLSAQERKELVKQLVDTLEIVPPIDADAEDADDQEPWGKRLVRLLQQTDLADWGDPSIEDPVEAVEALRHQEQARLDAYWNGDI